MSIKYLTPNMFPRRDVMFQTINVYVINGHLAWLVKNCTKQAKASGLIKYTI